MYESIVLIVFQPSAVTLSPHWLHCGQFKIPHSKEQDDTSLFLSSVFFYLFSEVDLLHLSKQDIGCCFLINRKYLKVNEGISENTWKYCWTSHLQPCTCQKKYRTCTRKEMQEPMRHYIQYWDLANEVGFATSSSE